nr:MAG TPA: coat protein [Caudoviricetes sp.]
MRKFCLYYIPVYGNCQAILQIFISDFGNFILAIFL